MKPARRSRGSRPATPVKKLGPLLFVLAFLLVILTVIEYFYAPHYRPVFPWHHVPGYMGLIGVGASILVVYVAKGLGLLLHRPEDDHDRD